MPNHFSPQVQQGWKALLANADEEIGMELKGALATVTIKDPPPSLKAGAKPRPYRVLVIGDSGTGKTHFLGTMPKPFVADFDNGLTTLSGSDVTYRSYSIDGWTDFKAEVMDWRAHAQYGCETFCLDSLTMAADAAFHYVLQKARRSEPTIKDWGDAIREVKDILGYITTLPCHVVVTAHNQFVRDEVMGDIQYVPLIFGKDLPHRLGIYFDEVYSTQVVTTIEGGKTTSKYRLQVRPDMRSKILKSRMNTDGKLFETYEDPSFPALLKKAGKPLPENL